MITLLIWLLGIFVCLVVLIITFHIRLSQMEEEIKILRNLEDKQDEKGNR